MRKSSQNTIEFREQFKVIIMFQEEKYILKSITCEKCGKILECRIDKKHLNDMRDNQLFNFVLMHANDHTLVIAVDGKGNIRRTRIASLNSNDSKEKKVESFKGYHVIEESNSLVDAFNAFFKQGKQSI